MWTCALRAVGYLLYIGCNGYVAIEILNSGHCTFAYCKRAIKGQESAFANQHLACVHRNIALHPPPYGPLLTSPSFAEPHFLNCGASHGEDIAHYESEFDVMNKT